jgi:hypothetical protein
VLLLTSNSSGSLRGTLRHQASNRLRYAERSMWTQLQESPNSRGNLKGLTCIVSSENNHRLPIFVGCILEVGWEARL